MRLEEMSADFFARGLKIVFAFMSSTGRGFEARSCRLFGTPSDQAEYPGEEPATRLRDVARVVASQSVVMMEEVAVESLHAIDRLMTASVRCRRDCRGT